MKEKKAKVKIINNVKNVKDYPDFFLEEIIKSKKTELKEYYKLKKLLHKKNPGVLVWTALEEVIIELEKFLLVLRK